MRNIVLLIFASGVRIEPEDKLLWILF